MRYGGDPFAYDFEIALAKAKSVGPTGSRTADEAYWLRHFPKVPTELALRRHARKFGPEGVSEIAAIYGYGALSAETLEANGPRQRRTTNSLKTQVTALHERGIVPAAIADALNLSDRRVRQLVPEAA